MLLKIGLKSSIFFAHKSLLYHIKHCALFQSHQGIKTGIVVPKCSIRVKIGIFVLCDLEIWRMTLEINRNLLYTTSSYVYHVKAISKFKLEFKSGNAQFGSKSTIVWPRDLEIWQVTLKEIGHLFYAISSVVYHFKAIGELKLELQSGNALFGSKLAIFCSVWPWNWMDGLEKP